MLDQNIYTVNCRCGEAFFLNKSHMRYQTKTHRQWLKHLRRETTKGSLEQHVNPDVAEKIIDFLN